MKYLVVFEDIVTLDSRRAVFRIPAVQFQDQPLAQPTINGNEC